MALGEAAALNSWVPWALVELEAEWWGWELPPLLVEVGAELQQPLVAEVELLRQLEPPLWGQQRAQSPLRQS